MGLKFVTPMWIEVLVLLFFAMGFATLRMGVFKRTRGGRFKLNHIDEAVLGLSKTIEAEAAADHTAPLIKAWRAAAAYNTPLPLKTLKLVVQALMDSEPDVLAEQI